MSPIMRGIVEFFDSEGWKYWRPSHSRVHQVLLFVEAENGYWVCVVEAREAAARVLVRALVPARVHQERLPAVLEYITEANTRLAIGSLSVDLDVGCLTYKTCVEDERIVLAPELIRPLVEHTILTADRYLPDLMRVIYGAVRPFDALEQVERCTIEEMIELADDWLEQ